MCTCGSVLVAGYSCMVAVASSARTFSSVFSFFLSAILEGVKGLLGLYPRCDR